MHTCRNCNQSFQTELALELHRDTCEKAQLFCQVCGDRFRERDATQDGWHYECPNESCDGEGLREDLYQIDDVRAATH
ncbi:HVO_2901 family zinc finger protein [Natronococcus jeotgali]|uniref:Transcription regulator/DNA-binding protein n=1 Tax=Natronococcus jeotgali DSM 18795 TaxID=1227498 RepID=L9WZR3_9EURY|nr:HVO_2901 family zinc finger protein [Natronococcus jeotgali]ELY53858.1 transcription regulator/DNA-binding protein [Natronococcus jeotgali DSM 18795]